MRTKSGYFLLASNPAGRRMTLRIIFPRDDLVQKTSACGKSSEANTTSFALEIPIRFPPT